MRLGSIQGCGTLLLASVLAACAGAPAAPAAPAHALRLIGTQTIAHQLAFRGTVVGGLSAIDYDARSGGWIMVSDDRAEHGSARFYSARLEIDAAAFRSVTLDGVHFFTQADGTLYPSAAALQAAAARGEVADIEALRFDPAGDGIWYASEGDGARCFGPFVRHASARGDYISNLPLPPMLRSRADHAAGPRPNLNVEGIAFAPDGKSLWLALEAPLFEDGALPDNRHGAFSRISRFDQNGAMLAQYAYLLDPIQAAAAPGRFSDNGVSELLAIDERHLLVLERSGVQDAGGRFAFYTRLYVAELDQASDIRAMASLDNANFTPLRKHLLLNLNTLGLPVVDNFEGMAWGPVLPNGHRTLVLVSDDNFSPGQLTQLLAFELL